MPPLKILVDPAFRSMHEIFSPSDRDALEAQYDALWLQDEPMPLEQAASVLPEVDAVVCASWRYGDALYAARKLKAILTVSGGFPQDLDYAHCHRRYVHVLSAAPAFGPQVAEMALGLAIASARDMVKADRDFRAGTEAYLHAGNRDTFLLFDKPVGFIGFGGLAQSLHPLLAPFRPRLMVYDPWVGDRFIRAHGGEPVALETLMRASRFIFVLAIPSTENEGMITRALLETIRSDATFLLMSRAHVVDFDALTELVLAGRFRAGIDVFPEEPLALDHPIRQAEGAILSAHRAGTVPEALWDIGAMVLDDLEALARGVPPRRLQPALPELVSRYTRLAARRGRA